MEIEISEMVVAGSWVLVAAWEAAIIDWIDFGICNSNSEDRTAVSTNSTYMDGCIDGWMDRWMLMSCQSRSWGNGWYAWYVWPMNVRIMCIFQIFVVGRYVYLGQ